MNSIAPTSTPRVGCAASSTWKSRPSSRARRRSSAGCRPTARAPAAPASAGRMSNARDLPPRVVARSRSRSSARAAREAMLLAEDEVVGDRVVEHEAAPVPVLGDVREPARRRARARRAPATSRPPSAMRAAARRARSPAIASISSVCPLPSTPAMPRISPARDLEATRRRPRSARRAPATVRSRTRAPRTASALATGAGVARAGTRRARVAASRRGRARAPRRARPSPARSSRGVVSAVRHARRPSRPARITVIVSEIVDHLVELVRDEHDRAARVAQRRAARATARAPRAARAPPSARRG